MKQNIKTKAFGLALSLAGGILAAPLAFAGGPTSTLPVQTQLRADLHTLNGAQHLLSAGKLAKAADHVQRTDFALQNAAARLHVPAPFPHMADHLMASRENAAAGTVTAHAAEPAFRAVLSKDIAAERAWILHHEKTQA
ncbi:MAG: hypothetical protein M0T84_01665 [Betaproteobacteria bacterium]|nr:hypothetical protein [Betaproteobacteria bacterium]